MRFTGKVRWIGITMVAVAVLSGTALARTATPESEDAVRGEQRRQQLIEARRDRFAGAPAYPEGIKELARESDGLLTADLHARFHSASTDALGDVDWDELSRNPALELLVIPLGWSSVEEVFDVIDQFGGQMALSSLHVAFPGSERTTIGVIERLPDVGWDATLAAWDEFFVASMQENLDSTSQRLTELAEADDTHASESRYLSDVDDMLVRASETGYPVYAFTVIATPALEHHRSGDVIKTLLGHGLGGFVIPQGGLPSGLTPPQDPARDQAIRDAASGAP
jgi:hypothetical protein